jgi:trans-aconitate 2-methyltransferase
MSEWNPEQYARFERERSQPFYDLLAMVRPAVAMRVIDLGCGTGELTRELHRRLAAASTLGIDSSETMLAKAAAIEEPGLAFARGRIEDFAPDRPADLVFSNAALQWVDDHPQLLARIAGMVAPSGQLAVQIPSNDAHPSHRVAAEVASEPPFRHALGGWTRVFPNLSLAEYARALDRLGFGEQHVRMQIYPHRLATRDDVVEWVKGTLLTAYRERLPAELREPFEERYRARLREVLPDERPFFFPFARTLFWAAR